MSELGSSSRRPNTKVWSIGNNRQRECCSATLLAGFALAAGLWSSQACADSVKEGGAPTDRKLAAHRRRTAAAPSQRHESPHRLGVELLGHAFYADLGVGALGVGLEAVYMPWPHFGFGAQFDTFGVDNGEYPRDRSVLGGTLLLTFAEADLLSAWFTPYVRFGGGLASYDRMVVPAHFSQNAHVDTSSGSTAQVSLGIALRGGPFLLRISASPTLLDGSWTSAYLAGVGLRF
jgi:hypothetical protein